MAEHRKAGLVTGQIGNKIRQLRTDRNMKLGAFAEKSGVSIAMLSKIENGRVIPTLPSLFQILNSLSINIADFFEDIRLDDDFPGYLFIAKEEQKPQTKEEESEGFDYKLILNQNIDKSSLEISHLTLLPGAKRAKVSTSGLEYIYLLKGEVKYELGNEKIRMRAGDSLFFDGNIPHVPHNKSNEASELLVIYFITM